MMSARNDKFDERKRDGTKRLPHQHITKGRKVKRGQKETSPKDTTLTDRQRLTLRREKAARRREQKRAAEDNGKRGKKEQEEAVPKDTSLTERQRLTLRREIATRRRERKRAAQGLAMRYLAQ
ncbi:hypothetical protein IAT40_004640 [Kwoniella sp. CBS 6097]